MVEDEAILAENLRMVLERAGFKVLGVSGTGADAIEKASSVCPQLVLMDIKLRGPMDGIEAASTIMENCEVSLIYLTGNTDESTRERAMATAPTAYLEKPFVEAQLCGLVHSVINSR